MGDIPQIPGWTPWPHPWPFIYEEKGLGLNPSRFEVLISRLVMNIKNTLFSNFFPFLVILFNLKCGVHEMFSKLLLYLGFSSFFFSFFFYIIFFSSLQFFVVSKRNEKHPLICFEWRIILLLWFFINTWDDGWGG